MTGQPVALITYLVEDNQTILDNLIETLEEIASVKVVGHAATEAEATRWLLVHDGHWQLAVVDLFLQEGSGLGVLAGCRQREAYQKVVVLTNYATDDVRRRAMELGADAVVDMANQLDEVFDDCVTETAKEVAMPQSETLAPSRAG